MLTNCTVLYKNSTKKYAPINLTLCTPSYMVSTFLDPLILLILSCTEKTHTKYYCKQQISKGKKSVAT